MFRLAFKRRLPLSSFECVCCLLDNFYLAQMFQKPFFGHFKILNIQFLTHAQFDNKGRNYLHVAVSNNDVDSVLFLISIEVNVNSVIQDGSHRTPLHLAIPTGSEIIVRHLVSY